MDQANVRPNGGGDMCAQICLYTVSSHSIMPVRSSPERWKGLSSEISLWLSVYVCSVALVVSNSLWPYGLQPARLLSPWASPGKNTGMGCCALLGGSPDPGIKPVSPVSPALRRIPTGPLGKPFDCLLTACQPCESGQMVSSCWIQFPTWRRVSWYLLCQVTFEKVK